MGTVTAPMSQMRREIMSNQSLAMKSVDGGGMDFNPDSLIPEPGINYSIIEFLGLHYMVLKRKAKHPKQYNSNKYKRLYFLPSTF